MIIFHSRVAMQLLCCCICFVGCKPQETSQQEATLHQATLAAGLKSICLPIKTANVLNVVVRDYGATEGASDIKRLARAIEEMESHRSFSDDAAETIVDFAQRLNAAGNSYSLPLSPGDFGNGESTRDIDRIFEDAHRLAKYQDALHVLSAAEFEQGNYDAGCRLLEHSLVVNHFQGQLGGTSYWLRRCDATLVNLVAILRCCSSETEKPPASLKQALAQLYDQAKTDSALVRALDWELHSRLAETEWDGNKFEELKQNQQARLLKGVARMVEANHDLSTIAWSKHPWIDQERIQPAEETASVLDIYFPNVLNRELQRRVAIAIALATVEASHDPSLQLSEQIKKRVDSLKLPANCVRYRDDHLVLVQFNVIDASRELCIFNWSDNKIISFESEPSAN